MNIILEKSSSKDPSKSIEITLTLQNIRHSENEN